MDKLTKKQKKRIKRLKKKIKKLSAGAGKRDDRIDLMCSGIDNR